MKKNVLVTGAYGQLGSELKRIESKYTEFFNFQFTDYDTLDITNAKAVENFVANSNTNYIINCAAYTAVDKAEDDIEMCYKVNRDAAEVLANAATKHGAKIVHVSTDYVFAGDATKPYMESDSTNPQSVYGKSKAEGEEILTRLCPQSVIIRTAWLYSIFGNNFVKTMIKLGNERAEINVVADQVGSPTNAADLAAAIMQILVHAEQKQFVPGIYHYTNEGVTNWCDFTIAIHQCANIGTCKVSPITTDKYPTRAKRPAYSVLSKDKIKSTFNLTIPQWNDSLARCVNELMK